MRSIRQAQNGVTCLASSRRDYARYLEEIGRLWGNLMVAGVEAKHILALRDKKAATPAGGELYDPRFIGGNLHGAYLADSAPIILVRM